MRRVHRRFLGWYHKPISADRPRWSLILALTFAGAGLLAIGYFVDPYSQAVLIGIGSALFLFSLLTYAEPRLVEHVGASLRLASLSDIQSALRAELDHLSWSVEANGQSQPDVSTQINACVVTIAAQIVGAGFRQCDQPVGEKKVLFRDRNGLNIELALSWEGGCLAYSIVSKYFRDSWQFDFESENSGIHLRSSLIAFQDRVVSAMRELAMHLAKQRSRR